MKNNLYFLGKGLECYVTLAISLGNNLEYEGEPRIREASEILHEYVSNSGCIIYETVMPAYVNGNPAVRVILSAGEICGDEARKDWKKRALDVIRNFEQDCSEYPSSLIMFSDGELYGTASLA